MNSPTQPRKLGFAGLGAMGFGMVSNLIKKGFAVSGFDVSVSALERLAKIGGRPCTSAAETAKDQHKFFIMVATPAQADAVIFGPQGLIDTLPEKAIVCLFSTVPPIYVTSLPERLRVAGRQDICLLDCPVSGGFVGAANGTLSIMMGGDSQGIEAVQPDLLAISAPGRLFTTGGLGSASTLKMINQHLAGNHIVVAGEVLAFAKSLGLSTRQAHELLMSSDGASWIMGDRGKTMLTADWTPKSAVDIFVKDLGIVTETADDLHLSCPIVSTAAELFIERSSTGYGRDDDASVVCIYEAITGKKVAGGITPNGHTPNGIDIKSEPLVFIVSNNELQQHLSTTPPQAQALSSNDLSSLRQSLDQLAPGTLVGVDQVPLLSMSPEYAHLIFFDYKVLPQIDKEPCIIFTNCHYALQGSLEAALGPGSTAVPVIGGSALDMSMVIDLARLLHMAVSAENFALAHVAGVAPQLVYDLVNGAAGSSAQFSNLYPKMLSEDYTSDNGLPSLEVAEKKLRDIKVTMSNIKFPGRLCSASYQMFKSARRQQGGASRSVAGLASAWM